jgi:signal transduction histidine kinase
MGSYLLEDIIKQGKKSVIPIARFEGVRFDNININIPNWKLYVDEGAFIMVFANLLINAIKYRKPQGNEGFHVNIIGTEGDDWLIINVTDSGLGVDDEDKEKIFLLGYRGKNAVKQVSDGFGVGLHLVSQIINDFGGEISLTNLREPTIFQIKLPRKLFHDNYTKEATWTGAK